MEPTIERKYVYKLVEAATLLRVQPSTVRAMIERGDLTKVPNLRHIKIPAWSLERLVGSPPP